MEMMAMNKKITAKLEDGRTCYCILSGDESLEDQFNVWYFGSAHPGQGICANFTKNGIEIVDYYHAETMAIFPIINIEDTDLDIIAEWINVET
jgi:hypothetical protein